MKRRQLMAHVQLPAFALGLSAAATAAPGDVSLAVQFDGAPIVVLAQVEESTFPKAYHSREDAARFRDASATLLVITSWKGPYHAGATIRAVQPQSCGDYPCVTYPFQTGEIVLVFAFRQYAEPISAPGVKAPEAQTMTDLYLLSWGGGQQAPTLLPQCAMPTDVAEDWKPLAKPPAHADALLDLSTGKGSVRSQLGPELAATTETWFRSKTGKLRYCRYVPAANVCSTSASWVEFSHVAGHWKAGDVYSIFCNSSRSRGITGGG